eukprot:CAMPEP_0177604300 /NCGR_PEP_ID=MMETSP0419_2-20121207/16041_1 /TAXON_ID=582737 /ORGANISM="Tetraselmis sp., Strain GSL018" /LENGTH=179 /DNA_ID=CAMNT_0019098267 /DNA_START=58 /DNA_END=594 /DNA_ORIENTATION=-
MSSCPAALRRVQAPRTVLPLKAGGSLRSGLGASRSMPLRRVTAMAASLEFIRGVKETTVPDVKLTRSRDGSSGTATFIFSQPTVFEAGNDLGEITGLYMNDDEGTLTSIDVSAKFVNGKPDRIECKYVMKSPFEWDRFMRFMERYAEENGLASSPSSSPGPVLRPCPGARSGEGPVQTP